MSSIPDHTEPSDRMAGTSPEGPAERIQAAGQRAEETTGRLAAAIQGALEGFVEALERYEVASEGRQAVEHAGEVTRAGAVEAKAQSQTPEMRELGSQLQRAGQRVGETTHAATDRVREGAQHAGDTVRETVDQVKRTASHAKEEVKVRAEAVAETGRRARVAPRHIGHELGEALNVWKRSVMTSLAMFSLLTIFSAIALVVLTIALVVGLNEIVGDPAGTFVVALLYVVIAGIAWGVARASKKNAADERRERMENVREELRHVGRPVKQAFSRGKAGY